LTHQIDDVQVSNRSVGGLTAFALVVVIGSGMAIALLRAPWHIKEDAVTGPTTYGIGDSFLGTYLLPFELASVVLLMALVGALVLSRKELRD
jgi:NAD(P)H-quinone oxidoreductase subunit 6